MSDGSAAPYVSTVSTPSSFVEKVYTIQFQAASANQTLTITDQVTRDDGFAYVALESASVSDQTVPQIDTVTPLVGNPGDQITITGTNFGAVQGTSGISLNGVAMSILSWSDSSITATVPLVQSGAVIVSRGLANSNGVVFTVNLPPPPVISFISPDAGVAGTTVTIFGSNFGAAQNNSTVTFSGISVIPSSWSDTTIVVAAPAVHSGPVVVKTASGASNEMQFSFTPGIRFSLQSAYVTPDEANLEIGASVVFTLTDPSGVAITDATWSVDDASIASISSDPAGPANATLQALAPGEVTITATSSVGTAQAKATIYAVGSVPPGTGAWGFYPQTQDNYFGATAKSRRINPDNPYLYLVEGTFDFSRVNGVDDTGHLLERVELSPADPTNTFDFPVVAAGTNDGGLLVMIVEGGGPNDPSTTFHRLGPDAKPLWTYSVPSEDVSAPAIGPDGTIYFWQEVNFNIALMALDDSSGTARPIYQPNGGTPPVVISSEQPGPINPDGTTVKDTNPWKPCADFFKPGQFDPPLPSDSGTFSFQPIVGTDGSVYVLERRVSSSFSYDKCQVEKVGTDPTTNDPIYVISSISGQLGYAATLDLVRLNSSGSATITEISSTSYSGSASDTSSDFSDNWVFNDGSSQLPALEFDKVVPNADGGAIMTWGRRSTVPGDPFQGFITNVVNDAPSTSALPFQGAVNSFGGFGDLAANDQGTVFFDGLNSVTAFDITSGSPKWTIGGNLLAATDDGGALISSDSSVHAADASGNLSADSLMVGGTPSYLAEGMFLQSGPAGGSIQGEPTDSDQLTKILAGPWPVPVLGTPVAQVGAIPIQLKEVAEPITHDPGIVPTQQAVTETGGCTGFDRGQVRTDLAALMAPIGSTESLPDGNGNSVQSSTPASNVVSMKNNTGHTITLSPHIPPFGNNPADTTVRLTIDPTTIPADGQYHEVTFTGMAASDVNRPVRIEAFDNVTAQNLGDILQVDVKAWHRWFIDYYSVSELNGRLRPNPPAQNVLQSELDRIFRPQANLGFTLRNIGSVADNYDVRPRDNKLHIAHIGSDTCQLGWTDTTNGSAFAGEACPDDTELTPMYQRLINGQRAASNGQQIDIDNSDTFYLLFFQQFDANDVGGFAIADLAKRRLPAVVHTNYDPELPTNFDHDRFIAVASAHEIGHKLGRFNHHLLSEPNGATYLMVKTFQVVPRPGTILTDATKYPCRLSQFDWNHVNYVYPNPR